MVFIANRPIASEKLSASQPMLQGNNQSLDSVFGIDHYQFSNATANSGFHKKVTTVNQGSHASTTVNPVLYSAEDTANIGVIQYSRGPSDAVPTPVTSIQSPSTPFSLAASTSSDVLDFTGTTIAFGEFFYSYKRTSYASGQFFVFYRFTGGTAYTNVAACSSGAAGILIFSGNILKINNGFPDAMTDIFWTLNLQRVQT